MPYLPSDFRAEIENATDLERMKDYFANIFEDNDAVGCLNYIIFSLVISRLTKKGFQYQRINGLVGALECCKQEIYRRLAAPYEDGKIYENGDVR